MTVKTPIYGIEYLVQGEPVRNTRAALENNAKTIEAALVRGGVAAPNAADLATLAGRVSTLETQDLVSVYTTATTALPANTWTALSFGAAEVIDNDAMHSPTGTPTRLFARKAGIYRPAGTALIAAPATNCRYLVQCRKNGVALPNSLGSTPALPNIGDVTVHLPPGLVVSMAANDYVELWALNGSAASVNATFYADAASTFTLEQIR